MAFHAAAAVSPHCSRNYPPNTPFGRGWGWEDGFAGSPRARACAVCVAICAAWLAQRPGVRSIDRGRRTGPGRGSCAALDQWSATQHTVGLPYATLPTTLPYVCFFGAEATLPNYATLYFATLPNCGNFNTLLPLPKCFNYVTKRFIGLQVTENP